MKHLIASTAFLVCWSGAATASEQTPRRTLSAGTGDETPYFETRGPRGGPTILVVAGIHGDEPAPPLAAERVRHWQLRRGTLVTVPRANPRALARRSRLLPGERFADLNRNFPTRAGDEPKSPHARQLWSLVTRTRPHVLLDLHEGWGVHRLDPATMGSSVVFVPDERVTATTAPLAATLLHQVNATVADPRRHFELISPGPAGSLARSATEVLGVPTLVLETTRIGQPVPLRVEQHLTMVRALLESLGMLDGAGADFTASR